MAASSTPVEIFQTPKNVRPYPRHDGLRTHLQKDAAKGWTKEEIASGSNDVETLHGAASRRVCWFGMIREIEENKAKDETILLMEMKYFDGLTDLHIHVVSIFGAGDFRAVLRGTGHKIKRLSLARIYGTVTKEVGGVPDVQAQYVWDWGLFVMPYGNDKSNPQWKALRKVPIAAGLSAARTTPTTSNDWVSDDRAENGVVFARHVGANEAKGKMKPAHHRGCRAGWRVDGQGTL